MNPARPGNVFASAGLSSLRDRNHHACAVRVVADERIRAVLSPDTQNLLRLSDGSNRTATVSSVRACFGGAPLCEMTAHPIQLERQRARIAKTATRDKRDAHAHLARRTIAADTLGYFAPELSKSIKVEGKKAY